MLFHIRYYSICKLCLAGIVIMLSSVSLIAQETESNSNESKGRIIVRAVIQGNDTIPFIYLKPYRVIGRRKFKTRRAQVKYYKLVRDVKKAYPYARLAASLLQQYNKELDSLNSEKDQKNYLKEIKNLTVTQGRILLKLVDRETGNTSYVLLKELRSSFSAIFWQTLARLFGNNLKSTYNPYGADKKIEDIVRMIEEDAAENLN